MTYKPSGLIAVEFNRKLTLGNIAQISTESGRSITAEGRATPRPGVHVPVSATEIVVTRHLHRPVVFHDFGGPTVLEIRAGLDRDEAVGLLIAWMTATANRYWSVKLPGDR